MNERHKISLTTAISTTQPKTLVSDEEVDWIIVEPGVKRKVMTFSEQMMLVKVAFEAGRVGALHHHPHLQISYVASGVFEITINGVVKTLRQGDAFFVPKDAVHGAVCVEAGMLVDVFSPMRADFLK